MANLILINPFEVPDGREEECLRMWEQAAEYLRNQPGFVSTKLHRAVTSGARFKFINVAEWESAEAFQEAVGSAEFQRLTAGSLEDFPHYPALYNVVRA